MPTKEQVVDALRAVEDPELGMDIVELGLFYGAEIDGPSVTVQYTLTSMGCPAGAMIQEDIDRVVQEIPGVEAVSSELSSSKFRSTRSASLRRICCRSYGLNLRQGPSNAACQGLLRTADGFRRRPRRHADRAGGDFWSGHLGDSVQGHG